MSRSAMPAMQAPPLRPAPRTMLGRAKALAKAGARAGAIPVLAAMSGCSLIPAYQRPAQPVAPTYPYGGASGGAASGIAPADLGWRDFFADPALQELIALSLANNRDLRVAAENVESAQASYRVQHASLFPTIDATGSETAERLPADVAGTQGVPGGSALHLREYSLGLGAVSYEVDLFGALRSAARQAREQYLSQAETRTSTQIALVAQMAAEYLSWIADREALNLSDRTAAAQHHAYDLTRLNTQGGNGTALDVAQAETTWRTAEASHAQYRRQAAQDMDEIVLLAGTALPPALQDRMMRDAALSAQPEFPPLPQGLPSDLLRRRPDIRAAEHTLLAANANIGAARAAFFPELTLTGNAGTASTGLRRLFGASQASYDFNPQISLPIFDAGKNFANLDLARVQKRIEIANYEKAIQSAFHDVSDALIARETYGDQVAAEQKLVDADQRYFDLSKMRFTAGVDTYLNVLVAENALFSAQLNLVSLKLAQQQNLVTLYKALGGGWAEHVGALATTRE